MMSAGSHSDRTASGPSAVEPVAAHKAPATIRKRSDFLAANHGLRCVKPGFILLIRRNVHNDGTMRVGFTVTKKIGNAVVRNRMKRRFRALARNILPEHGEPNADHILIGRADGIERDYAQLESELLHALATIKKSDGKPRPWQPRKSRGKSPRPPKQPATGG